MKKKNLVTIAVVFFVMFNFIFYQNISFANHEKNELENSFSSIKYYKNIYKNNLNKFAFKKNNISYSLNKIWEQIEKIFSITKNAKLKYYHKMGRKYLATGLFSEDINDIKISKQYFEKALKIAKVKNNENYKKDCEFYILLIEKIEKNYEFEKKVNNSIELLKTEKEKISNKLEEYYNIKDYFILEKYKKTIAQEKKKSQDELKNIVRQCENEMQHIVKEYIEKTQQLQDYKKIVELNNQYNELIKSKTEKYKNVLKIEDKYLLNISNIYKQIYSYLSKNEDNINKKAGTIDERDLFIKNSIDTIKSEFVFFSKQKIDELILEFQRIFNKHIKNNSVLDIINKQKETEQYIYELAEEKIQEIEKLRTADKYEMIKNILSKNKDKKINLINDKYNKLKNMKQIKIVDFDNKKELVKIKRETKKQIEESYQNTLNKIKKLISSRQTGINIDREIESLIESFIGYTNRRTELFISESESIENITDFATEKIENIYSLDTEYKNYQNQKEKYADKRKYEQNLLKHLSEKSMESYKSIILKNRVNEFKKELWDIIKNANSYKNAYLQMVKTEKLNYIYKSELNMIPNRWNSIYNLSKYYKARINKTNEEIEKLNKDYDKYMAEVENFDFLKEETTELLGLIYNSYISEKNILFNTFYNNAENTIIKDTPLNHKEKIIKQYMQDMIKEINKIIKETNKNLKIHYLRYSYLNKGYVYTNNALKEINEKIIKYIEEIPTNRTYMQNKFNELYEKIYEEFSLSFDKYSIYFVETNLLGEKMSEEFFESYKEKIDKSKYDILKLIDLTAQIEIDLTEFIENMIHLRHSVYNHVAELNEKYNFNQEQINKINEMLYEYTNQLSKNIDIYIDELKIMHNSVEGVTQEQIDALIKDVYIPQIENLTNLYIEKIDNYINQN